MLNFTVLGQLAAKLYKTAMAVRRGRSGRTVKLDAAKKELHAAGEPRMNTPGVFAHARGRRCSGGT